MATSNYEIKDAPNYDMIDDEKVLAQIASDKQADINANDQTYKDMIAESDGFYQAQIDASEEWADKQSQLQKKQTAFAIEQIEQQKEQTHKDYIKEQSGAYVDWQKQSNEYGAEAEKMAAGGLDKTGYSESSQVSMYNTYQNRVATARETFNRAILAYDNSIQEAKLQNNAVLAEIAYQAFQEQLSLSLEGFQYKNNLIIEQANKKLEIENMYHNKWTDALALINEEKRLAEDARQFVESQKFTSEQNRLDRDHEKDMLTAKTAAEKEVIEKEYTEKKAYLEKELENEKALLQYEDSLKNQSSSGDSGNESTGQIIVDQEGEGNTPDNPYYPISLDSANKVAKDLEISNMTPAKLESLIKSGKVTYNQSTKEVKVASWVIGMNNITSKYFGFNIVK